MPDYILTHKALEDLSTIWDYSYETWSEKQADRYYKMLLDACQDLADELFTGKHYPEIGEAILGYRSGQHVIFYRHAKYKIEIIRFLHVRMDYRNRMQE